MIIGIDLDDVLNNHIEKWIEKHNVINNDNASVEDIIGWGISDYVSSGEEIYSYITNELLKTLKPQVDSIEVTRELSDRFELYVVTATSPKFVDVKAEWLSKFFPHIPIDNLIICNNKNLVSVDVLIDDAPHNIINFPNHVITYDQPWNRSLRVKRRAKNWKEVKKELLDIYEHNFI